MRGISQGLAVLCLLVSQHAQAQQPDQFPSPMPPAIEWPPERTEANLAVVSRKAEVWPGATRPERSAKHPVAGAPERCPEAPVDVAAASPDERRLACSAASEAIQRLGRCGIALRKPLKVQIMSEVRHPFSGQIFGLLDTKQERVLVTQEANIPSLVKDSPYAKLPQRDFYRSLIIHEVVHGVMHQNLKGPAATHAAYEYPAYALQIESLASHVRDTFLQSFDQAAIKAGSNIFSDAILFVDPYFFAARAYHHFKAAPNGCAYLIALLEREVAFIAPPQ